MDVNLQHQEHRAWLSQLDFYQDEVKIFQHELLKVVQSHPDYFRMAEIVDEYRDILLRKLQHIDELRHRIMLLERQIAQEEDKESLERAALKTEMDRFVQDFEAMKANFRRFVSRNN